MLDRVHLILRTNSVTDLSMITRYYAHTSKSYGYDFIISTTSDNAQLLSMGRALGEI